MAEAGEHKDASRALGEAEAGNLAETLRALASPSRLQVLYALQNGEKTVEQLAQAAGLSQSATSHNLRLLRTIRLVRARRSGRHVHYTLHDHHVPLLLAAIRHHHEHANPRGISEVANTEPGAEVVA